MAQFMSFLPGEMGGGKEGSDQPHITIPDYGMSSGTMADAQIPYNIIKNRLVDKDFLSFEHNKFNGIMVWATPLKA